MTFWGTSLIAVIMIIALTVGIWLLKMLVKALDHLVDLGRIAIRCRQHMKMLEKMTITAPDGMSKCVAEDLVLLAMEAMAEGDYFARALVGDNNRVYCLASSEDRLLRVDHNNIPAPDTGIKLWWVEVYNEKAQIWVVNDTGDNTWDIPRIIAI